MLYHAFVKKSAEEMAALQSQADEKAKLKVRLEHLASTLGMSPSGDLRAWGCSAATLL